ncbi:MAG: hypothetical protein ACK559_20620, partial [bacterium]
RSSRAPVSTRSAPPCSSAPRSSCSRSRPGASRSRPSSPSWWATRSRRAGPSRGGGRSAGGRERASICDGPRAVLDDHPRDGLGVDGAREEVALGARAVEAAEAV